MRRLPLSKALHALGNNARSNTLVYRLLPECGDIRSAQNELRWMKQHITEKQRSVNLDKDNTPVQKTNRSFQAQLESYVDRRSNGEPLQYILGTQPFGELEILCKPGVLIPRPETEAYTTWLADLVQKLAIESPAFQLSDTQAFRIVDYCTGSGCIALLLYSLLKPNSDSTTEVQRPIRIVGKDVSKTALTLASENQTHNIKQGSLHSSAQHDVQFEKDDVLTLARNLRDQIPLFREAHKTLDSFNNPNMSTQEAVHSIYKSVMPLQTNGIQDVIISNPPYIKRSEFEPGGTVTRSVRDFEPQSALVPPLPNEEEQEILNRYGSDFADVFYLALIDIAIASRTKLLLMEIGDNQQAERVRSLVTQRLQELFGREPGSTVASIETFREDGKVVQHHLSQFSEKDSAKEPSSDRAVVVKFGLERL